MTKRENTVVDISENLDYYKPSEIVKSLDHYIVGQEKAKKLVAVALRNRLRRKFVSEELKEEISPKNILMIGPTGVGKTEIARRMAQILDAPFIKVEATKFTERGYVGRDVEYMVRSMVNHSVNMVKSRMREEVKKDVYPDVQKVIQKSVFDEMLRSSEGEESDLTSAQKTKIRSDIKRNLKSGAFDSMLINVKLRKRGAQVFPMAEMFPGMEEMDSGIQSLFHDMGVEQEETKRLTVKEATELLVQQYMDDRIDKDRAIELGIKWAQEMGIIFIDEIDKIADKSRGNGPEVSREGVQRDLLPIVEGTTVNTKYGMVKTDHMLFIAAGAFHVTKPSDMIPELQGRFPIRVELKSLNKDDLLRILVEPKNSLIKQYKALLATEGLDLQFDDNAYERIVEIAFEINSMVEDIGARRLHTIMEYLLEDISFAAPEMQEKVYRITRNYVDVKLSEITRSSDLTRYIL